MTEKGKKRRSGRTVQERGVSLYSRKSHSLKNEPPCCLCLYLTLQLIIYCYWSDHTLYCEMTSTEAYFDEDDEDEDDNNNNDYSDNIINDGDLVN